MKLVIGQTKNWWFRKFFLANYVDEGDSRKFSSMNNSQYTVLFANVDQYTNINTNISTDININASAMEGVVGSLKMAA